MQRSKDGYVFSTGKKIRASYGIIGLAPHDTDEAIWSVSDGYDGTIEASYDSHHDDEPRLTPTERIELADYMIALWTEYKTFVSREE